MGELHVGDLHLVAARGSKPIADFTRAVILAISSALRGL
jgi:hypothetical protein